MFTLTMVRVHWILLDGSEGYTDMQRGNVKGYLSQLDGKLVAYRLETL